MLGQKVKTLVSQNHQAGYYSTVWDATNDTGQKVGSGMYFYLMKAGEYRAVNKMILLK
jgi:flagellar hook assembly protein FlgD